MEIISARCIATGIYAQRRQTQVLLQSQCSNAFLKTVIHVNNFFSGISVSSLSDGVFVLHTETMIKDNKVAVLNVLTVCLFLILKKIKMTN